MGMDHSSFLIFMSSMITTAHPENYLLFAGGANPCPAVSRLLHEDLSTPQVWGLAT